MATRGVQRVFNAQVGIPIIRIRDVTSGETKTFFNGKIVDGFWIENGDLIVGMDGDFNCRIWAGGRAILNQRVCKIVPDETKYDKNFMHYLLPSLSQNDQRGHALDYSEASFF